MKALRRPLLRWWLAMLPSLAALALNGFSAEEPQFKTLAEDYAAKTKIVEQMDQIILTDLKIERLTLAEAIDELESKGAGDKPGVINVVIRKPKTTAVDPASADDPFAGSDEVDTKTGAKPPVEPERLSLSAAKISFAHAVDRLCQQAGYCWCIEFNGEGMPVLVLKPRVD